VNVRRDPRSNKLYDNTIHYTNTSTTNNISIVLTYIYMIQYCNKVKKFTHEKKHNGRNLAPARH
jgi:hypothetical protein